MPPPITAMSKLATYCSLLFDQGRRGFARVGEQRRPIRRQAHLARDAGGREAPRRAIGVLRDRDVGARHHQHDVVGRAHGRDVAPLGRLVDPVRPAAAGDVARSATTSASRSRLQRPCSRRKRRTSSLLMPAARAAARHGGRDQHGARAAPRASRSAEAAAAHHARQLGEAAGDVDHRLRAQHRHRALLGPVAQLDVQRRPRAVLALGQAERVAAGLAEAGEARPRRASRRRGCA